MNMKSVNNTGSAIELISASPIKAVVSGNGLSCCDAPAAGVAFTTADKDNSLYFVKTSGHGCNGKQGYFTLDVYRTDFNVLLGSSRFDFDSDGNLNLEAIPSGDNKDFTDSLEVISGGYSWNVALYTPTLPTYNRKLPIALLDVWGEGRIFDDSGMVTGFAWAYNLNKKGQTISNGPDKGKPIPNMIPVSEYDNPTFPIDDSTVSTVTLMGAPITRKVSQEIYRVLNKTSGVVILFDPSEKDRGLGFP